MLILLSKKSLPSRLFFSIMKAIRVKKQLEEKIKIVITNNLIVSLLSSVNSSSCELCLKFSKIMNPNIIFAAKYIIFFSFRVTSYGTSGGTSGLFQAKKLTCTACDYNRCKYFSADPSFSS